MMRRLLPSFPVASLGTQLIILLLLAVVAAQAVSIWIFHDERRLALLAVARDSVLMRTVSLVRLIEETPPSYHTRILQASTSRFTALWIASEPHVRDASNTATEARLAYYLKNQFDPPREVYLDLRKPQKKKQDAPQHANGQRKDHGEKIRFRRLMKRHADLGVSIKLNDGSWFNLATDYRPPPRSLIPLLVQMSLTIAAVILIVALAVRRVARPLRTLEAAAGRLGRGDDLSPLPIEGPREVRALTLAFNDMQARLSRFVSDRTRMLAAISHDLRTPITSLRLRAEFIDDEENREKIIQILDEMAAMTEATLAFARDEARKEAAIATDLTSLLGSLADDQRDLGHAVLVADSGRIVMICRPLSLKRAFRNLIENGVRYGESVKIHLHQSPAEAVITISDKGPGVPEERLKDVFEPFVRLEESRSGETGGIGLGLAITRSIIHAHGGTISLENQPEGGLAVTVNLPL